MSDNDCGFGDFEFERRFYVEHLPSVVLDDPTPTLIVQSYYLAEQGHALRVRAQATGVRLAVDGADHYRDIINRHRTDFDFAAVTVKGPMNAGTRYEAERELDVSIALSMIELGGQVIVKNRYGLFLGTDGWVIDVFGGANRPLIIAECERGSPVTNLEIPPFCVSEVTEDRRFSNESLATHPFSAWAEDFGAELGFSGPTFMTSLGTNRPLPPQDTLE